MRFIDPRTDFAFKKIFGSAGHEKVLISLLNAFLYEGRNEITDIQLQDPYNVPRLKGMKDSYLDVRLRQSDGRWILVEMQVLNVPGFEKRVLYNLAKQYSNQMVKGDNYDTLDPVVALTITDFMMFDDCPDITSRYHLKEKKRLTSYLDDAVELVFVELPKFKKSHEEARQLHEKWLCFLREARNLQAVPKSLKKVPEIEEAFAIANYANLSEQEEWELMQKLHWLSDQKKLSRMQKDAMQNLEKSLSDLNRSETRRKQVEAQCKQVEAQRKQVEAQCKQEEAKRKQLERSLKKTALALYQSGMTKTDICKTMAISQAQLQELLKS